MIYSLFVSLATHGTFCQSDDDCAFIKYMKCSEDYKCVCHDKTISINDATCAPILDGFCEKHAECIVDDSICFNNKCQCKPKYKAVADDECRNCMCYFHVFFEHIYNIYNFVI